MTRYRQTNLKNYFDCPQKFFLSTQIPFSEPSMPMRYGLIFENYVLGEKPNHNADEWKAVLGRIKPDTLAEIYKHGDNVKADFIDGGKYVDLELVKEDYRITGEADFIGLGTVDGQEVTGIYDLKYTSSILSQWIDKRSRKDFLQSVLYPYLYYKATDLVLPFIYKIVENTSGLVLNIVIDSTEEDFRWVENFIKTVHQDMFYEPQADYEKCLGYKGRQQCQYLEHCSAGRSLLTDTRTYNFSDLPNF